MIITFHGFGSTRILSGFQIEIANSSTIKEIKNILIAKIKNETRYTSLIEIIPTTAFSSEDSIFNSDDIIKSDMIINLLPPVCGG